MFKVDNFLSEILSCYVKKSISKVECMQKLNKLTGDCVDKNVKMKCSELIVHNDTLSILENLHPHVLHQISVLFAIVCPIVDCQLEKLFSAVQDPGVLFRIIYRKICTFHPSSALNAHFRVKRHCRAAALVQLRGSVIAMTRALVGDGGDFQRNIDAKIRCLQTLALLFEMQNDADMLPPDDWSRLECSLVYFLKHDDDLVVNLALENLFTLLSKVVVECCCGNRSGVADFDHELLLSELRTAAIGRLQSKATAGRCRWFGGVLKDQLDGDHCCDTTAMRFFILCSMIVTIVGKLKQEVTSLPHPCCCSDWIGDLVMQVCKNRSIVSLFAENDDQLALLLLCCSLLYRFSLNCTTECLFPCSLWFEFFQSMNWNASAVLSVIFDTSVSFLLSFVTFLKLLNREWNKLSSVCFTFTQIERSDVADKQHNISAVEEGSFTAVTIGEVKQGRCQRRQYKIRPLPTVADVTTTPVKVVSGTCQSTMYSKFAPMLGQMREQLANGQHCTTYKSCTLLIDQILKKMHPHS
ncbi:hypothetical protein T4D_14458 [Trichinella pseudospiralis]|uniref:Uncharacterized protein n=1 Tax=Trichinella pseudospiralis TaxID=6337 RepID=A0A0V1FYM5_TRIPS|nr:hypothetical protein T4D_14458 [Trichinella pseudospiralis]